MLKKLVVKNFALIDYAEIIFTEGFNVLSGETGSGKSIVLESLNFVLGAKADKNLIRSGENECMVTAEFDLSSVGWAKQVYSDLDYEFDDTLIISRKFNESGKSVIKINGNTANVTILKKFTSYLVDVHGQSEHFSLLSSSSQLALLDKFGGEELSKVKDEIHNLLREYKEVYKEIDILGGEESHRLIRLDVLTYQINEIEKADIKEGEEENLTLIKEKLKHQEKIVTALSSIKYSLSGEGGASDVVSGAVKECGYVSGFGEEYSTLYDRLSSVYSEVDDLISTCENLLESFDFSEYNQEEIEDRLETIKKIKKKYGDNFTEIMEFLDSAVKEKEKLENFEVIFANLLKKEKELKDKLYQKFTLLRAIREKTADKLTKNVVLELKELGMQNAKFSISFSPVPTIDDCKFDGVGFDSIQFLFSANLGEPLKPLSTVISGGEMSRFMLAIKVQTSKYNDISTFVFDEIDAGISGNVAKIVGEKLVKISKTTQVISISHLPQIVSFGDNNLLIYKTTDKGNSYTRIKELDNDGKVKEITRLIGGDELSKSALSHSIEIIEQADKFKKTI